MYMYIRVYESLYILTRIYTKTLTSAVTRLRVCNGLRLSRLDREVPELSKADDMRRERVFQ